MINMVDIQTRIYLQRANSKEELSESFWKSMGFGQKGFRYEED